MKRYSIYIIGILLVWLGTACGSENLEQPEGADPTAGGQGTYLAIRLPRSSQASRTDGSSTKLSEDYEATVSSLALFLKTGDDEAMLIYRKEDLNEDLHLADSWLRISRDQLPEVLPMTDGQELYAVANYTGSSSIVGGMPDAVGGTVSLTDLLALSADDMSLITETDHLRRKFVMSAQTALTINDKDNPTGRIALIELERVAVKVRLTINLNEPRVLPNEKVFIEWVPNENEPPMAKLRNKVKKGKLFGEQTAVNDDDIYEGGTSSFDEYEAMEEQERATDGRTARYTVTTYSYPHVWASSDTDHESSLMVNIPFAFRLKDDPDDASSEETQNYYTVHFARAEAKLERNMFYDVTLNIKMIGAKKVEDAIQVSGNVSTLPDWELRNMYIDIENHFIYVEDNEFEMVDHLSFDFRSSEMPELYFHRGTNNSSYSNPSVWNSYYQGWVQNWVDKDTDAAINVSLQGYNNLMTKDRLETGNPAGILQEFNMDIPYMYYLTLVSGKVLKTVRVKQYPCVHFFLKGYAVDATDITNVTQEFDPSIIVLRQGRINYYENTDVIDEYYSYIAGSVEDEHSDSDGSWVITHNQADVQAYMANQFQVDDDDIEVVQTSTREGELLYYKAQEACLKRQKASAAAGDSPVKRWRLPTVKELLTMNEAKLSYRGYTIANDCYADYKGSLWNSFARPLSEGGHKYYAFGVQASTDGNRAYVVYDSRLKKSYPIGESTAKGYWGDSDFEKRGVEAFKDYIVTGDSYYVRCVRTISDDELESMKVNVSAGVKK